MRRGGGEAGRAPGQGVRPLPVRGSLQAGGFCVAGGREYLTGFHKRKVERRKVALEEIKRKLKEEQRKMKEEVPPTHIAQPSVGEGSPHSPHGGLGAGQAAGQEGSSGFVTPLCRGTGRPERRVGGWRDTDLFPSLSGTRST